MCVCLCVLHLVSNNATCMKTHHLPQKISKQWLQKNVSL